MTCVVESVSGHFIEFVETVVQLKREKKSSHLIVYAEKLR